MVYAPPSEIKQESSVIRVPKYPLAHQMHTYPSIDSVSSLGEVTVTAYFIYPLSGIMFSDSTGRRILKNCLKITSKAMDTEPLRKLPKRTNGGEYASWLDRKEVSPGIARRKFPPCSILRLFGNLIVLWVGSIYR